METGWCNRLTGLPCPNPEAIPLLGLWHSKGGVTWPGTEQDLEQPASASEPTETFRQSLSSLAASIRRIYGKDYRQWADLVPLDPTITSDLKLRDYETALIRALPHLETLSHNPRSHLTIEEIREQVGRARRVSHRAVASLAAHSEDWQTRTFLSVRPKRILAESRQDQWDIYENRAVATLRKRILAVLHPRLQKLNQILKALDEASEHSAAIRGTRFRRARLYQIWGEVFDTHPSRDLLAQLISEIDAARARLLALADTHLFKQMPHFSAVESPLHYTNVFQSDAHYRQTFHLWHKWELHSSPKPPSPKERAEKRRYAVEDWDLFVILLTIRACRQLGLSPIEKTAQPVAVGQRINLARRWSLAIQPDRSILLEFEGEPRLQILGIYSCLAAQAEKHVEAAIQLILETRRYPLLIVTADDPAGAAVTLSLSLLGKLSRLRTAALLSDGVALAEASPLRIDSTELVARAIHWVTAENEWPRLPLHETLIGWSEVWPDLPRHHGIHALGQNFQFSDSPSDSLITESSVRSTNARQRLDQTVAARDNVKYQERRARGDRRDRADVNVQKKELTAQKTEAENFLKICTAVHTCLLKIRDRFQVLQTCPCCKSTLVEKQEDTSIMTCYECETEWGRRTCATCHRDYAFIVPHDAGANVPPDAFDPLRIFGADLCATLLTPTTAPFLARLTECPHCKPQFAGC
jgi:hypothetical protein